ncbi:MAG: hypothetical protein H6767_00790 [Candidatus Peribacteria bacterium]|nr:MAG: hypothetical protein H6767_00790 [Candidatus Peribacteria bacterium]
MRKIIAQNQKFEQFNLPIEEAIQKLENEHESYKVELANKLKANGETQLSFYKNMSQQGQETFCDMCRGPHVAQTSHLDANSFKLSRIAGAYWLGDEKNPQLTRIYAYAFDTQ